MLIKKSRGGNTKTDVSNGCSVGKDTGHSACRLHSIVLSQVLVLLWFFLMCFDSLIVFYV